MELDGMLAAVRTAIAEVGPRASGLVRAIGDPDAPVTGSAWTLREASIHLVTDATVHTDLALGKPTWRGDVHSREGIAADNDRFIAEFPDADPASIADCVDGAVAAFLDATRDMGGADEVLWTSDMPVGVAYLAGLELGELILHGYDIASTLGAPWPIDPAHAQLVLMGYIPFYGTVLDPDRTRNLTEAYAIELRGGAQFVVRFVDGELRIEPPGSGPVDCVISADPVAFLLVMSGRISLWAAIALGLLGSAGDRPELALGFGGLFRYP